MPARLPSLVVSAVSVFGLLAVGGSRGLSQAVEVVVLVDPSAAEFGITVDVTVHVFDRGAPAEPSRISAVIDDLPGIALLTLVRQSVGVFKGAFVFESHPSLVVVNATVGGTQDSGTAVVYHTFDRVRVVPSTVMARPGQTIAVATDVRDEDGRLRDADSLVMTADVFFAPGFERQSLPTTLNWTRTAVGQYSAAYTVPLYIERDAFLEFRANVLREGRGSSVGARAYIDLPDSFLVWYRTLAVDASNATLEIDVALLTGVPRSNATVLLHTSPFFGNATMDWQATTDSSGAARFGIPLTSVPASFYGNATLGLQRQAFQGFLDLSGLPGVAGPTEPELTRENPDEVFEIGETAVLRFRLTGGEIAIPDQELFVYAYTASGIVLAERTSTDLAGRFEVQFVAPPDHVRLDVTGPIAGTWKAFHHDFVAVSRLLALVSSPDGWNLTISGRFPSSPGLWVARLGLSTKEESFPGPWTATGSFDAHRIVGGSGGAPFALDVSLPRFLAAGQSVSLSIWAESLRGEGEGIGLHEFHVTVVVGMSIPRPIDVGVLVILLGFGILIAISPFGWRWRRLPRRERENGEAPSPRRP